MKNAGKARITSMTLISMWPRFKHSFAWGTTPSDIKHSFAFMVWRTISSQMAWIFGTFGSAVTQLVGFFFGPAASMRFAANHGTGRHTRRSAVAIKKVEKTMPRANGNGVSSP